MKLYFIRAQSGTSKKSGNPYGLVELVSIDEKGGRAQTVFCTPAQAEHAAGTFRPLQEVAAQFATVMTGAGPRAELASLEPVK